MKKITNIILMLCLIACMAGLSSCGGSGPKPSGDAKDLSVEYGWTVKDTDPHEETIGAVITNNSDKVATNVLATVVPYDASGKVIEYTEDDPATSEGASGQALHANDIGTLTILPGESVGMSDWGFDDLAAAPDHIEVIVESVEWKDASEADTGSVTVTDYDYKMGADTISVSLRNDTDTDFDITAPELERQLYIVIVGYDSAGKIVGADDGFVTSLGAHSEGTAEVSLNGFLEDTEAKEVKVFAVHTDSEPEETVE